MSYKSVKKERVYEEESPKQDITSAGLNSNAFQRMRQTKSRNKLKLLT